MALSDHLKIPGIVLNSADSRIPS
ncbi:hypothetical protein THICB6_130214 [Thiomonas arsenitoxydans]|nr:hypothetical protein THICB6_130214 [Thiomonas arsenitoxydans]